MGLGETGNYQPDSLGPWKVGTTGTTGTSYNFFNILALFEHYYQQNTLVLQARSDNAYHDSSIGRTQGLGKECILNVVHIYRKQDLRFNIFSSYVS